MLNPRITNALIARRAPGRTLTSLAVSALVCSYAPGALADEAAPSQANTPPASAADKAKPADVASQPIEPTVVVVTANRRREPSREVPMQVSTVSTEELAKSGAKTLSDYLADQPGIDVKTYGGAGLGAISIRGVSTGDQTSSTVGTYVDDVAVGSSSAFGNGSSNALDMALLDLNHIEVLRGPQGTLYGAGAMGGVLKYVTNEPDTYELSGKVSVEAGFTRGGAPSNTESVVVNVPIKEDVAGVRLSAFTDREGGYVDATGAAAGRNINGGRTTGGRVSILVEPSSRFKVRLTETAQTLTRDGSDYVDYDFATGRPVAGSTQRELELREPYLLKLSVTGADLEYDLGWARLNSITSAQATRFDVLSDLSAAYVPLLTGADIDAESVGFRTTSEVKRLTQEFRLTSKAGQEFEWLGGLYWNHESASNDQLLGSTLTGGTPGPALLDGSFPSTYREAAAYADLTWNPIKAFALTGGIRVARNTQTFSEDATGFLTSPVEERSKSGETSKTYLLTAKYALTPTSNVYVRAASGYRPGGPNFIILNPETGLPDAPTTFKHDSLWSYEAGYKADLMAGVLSVEGSVYDINWNGIQQYLTVDSASVIVNSGQAKITGADLGVTYRPLQRVTLSANLAFNDAKLKRPSVGLGAEGDRLPNSALISGSASARYGFDMFTHVAYVGIAERFTGARNAGFEGSSSLPNYRLPSYALTDLQAGIDFKKVDVGFFVRNAFDKRAQISASTNFVPLGAPVQVSQARPRTVGLTLTSAF